MNGFFIYIVQSAVCLGALYLIYWFFLSRNNLFIIANESLKNTYTKKKQTYYAHGAVFNILKIHGRATPSP